jgi:hypothetical protein
MTVSVYDLGSGEQVNVESVTGNVVTLNTPFVFAHTIGIAISTLPPAIKEAAILFTSVLIKTRADDAFVMPALGSEPSQMVKGSSSGGPEQQLAEDFLMPYRRVA